MLMSGIQKYMWQAHARGGEKTQAKTEVKTDVKTDAKTR